MNGLINGFIMCDHEEISEYGEYIFRKCGLVSGQQYTSEKIYSESPKNDKNKTKLYIDICNILKTSTSIFTVMLMMFMI